MRGAGAVVQRVKWTVTRLELYAGSMAEEWRRGEFTISTDPDRLDIGMIHDYLSNASYWGMGRPIEIVRRSIENSLSFGVYRNTTQVGFARVVTDYATFAWLADVFILPEVQRRGIGKWLIGVVVSHPRLPSLRRWILATRDAHGLYSQYGFTPLSAPARFMERLAERHQGTNARQEPPNS